MLAFFKALPPCLIGMEACATAYYWARELTKLGHKVRLMPAKDVKAYVKRNKNDAVDAEAICEAVRRPTMRFVQAKSAEQQGRLMLHRARDLLMRQRTQVINALRRICASVCRRSRGPVARQEVGATPIAKAIAAVLAVKSGSPGLLIKREYLSEAEQIFEMTRSIYPAGQFRYRSELHLDRRA